MKTRAIKFRDYDMDSKELRYFDLDGYDRENHDCYGNVMQFTGLKDKYGVEVYEGDILNCHSFDKAYRKASVFYNENTLTYRLDVIDADFIDIADLHYRATGLGQSVEVIGNIHQNPELL